MKRLLILLGVLIVVFLIFGFLVDQGYVQNIEWQWLAVVAAAAAGPYKAIRNIFSFDKDVTAKILDKQEKTREIEKIHRIEYDQTITEKKMHIESLSKEIEVLEKKLDIIEERKKNVRSQVRKMSTEEKIQEAQDLWGS